MRVRNATPRLRALRPLPCALFVVDAVQGLARPAASRHVRRGLRAEVLPCRRRFVRRADVNGSAHALR